MLIDLRREKYIKIFINLVSMKRNREKWCYTGIFDKCKHHLFILYESHNLWSQINEIHCK